MQNIYSFCFKRTQKDHIESSLQLKKKSGLILNSILTPIFYSIVEALNAVFLGAIEPERVYTRSVSSALKRTPLNRNGYGPKNLFLS